MNFCFCEHIMGTLNDLHQWFIDWTMHNRVFTKHRPLRLGTLESEQGKVYTQFYLTQKIRYF